MRHFTEALVFLALAILAIPVLAQKGTGNRTGVARESIIPEVIEVVVIIKDIKTGPCAFTTGRSNSGTHLIVTSDDSSELNIHLGPTSQVSSIVKDLSPGQHIKCKVFRTPNLPENNFIVTELETDNTFYLLRDANLRPIWAGRDWTQ